MAEAKRWKPEVVNGRLAEPAPHNVPCPARFVLVDGYELPCILKIHRGRRRHGAVHAWATPPRGDYGDLALILDGLPQDLLAEREKLRLSIRRAADEIGIPKSTLERFEKADGETTVHTVVPILRWLGRNR